MWQIMSKLDKIIEIRFRLQVSKQKSQASKQKSKADNCGKPSIVS